MQPANIGPLITRTPNKKDPSFQEQKELLPRRVEVLNKHFFQGPLLGRTGLEWWGGIHRDLHLCLALRIHVPSCNVSTETMYESPKYSTFGYFGPLGLGSCTAFAHTLSLAPADEIGASGRSV